MNKDKKPNGICISDKHGEWMIEGYPTSLTETQCEEIAYAFDKVKDLEKKLAEALNGTVLKSYNEKYEECNKNLTLTESWVKHHQASVEITRKKLALAVEALEDFILAVSHADFCRHPIEPCSCMDTKHYNIDSVKLRAENILKQLSE